MLLEKAEGKRRMCWHHWSRQKGEDEKTGAPWRRQNGECVKAGTLVDGIMEKLKRHMFEKAECRR